MNTQDAIKKAVEDLFADANIKFQARVTQQVCEIGQLTRRLREMKAELLKLTPPVVEDFEI